MNQASIMTRWRAARAESQARGPIFGITLALPASLALWIVIVEGVRLFI